MSCISRSIAALWIAFTGLLISACGTDPAKVDSLFLKITSDAPSGGGELSSLRILFSKGDVHYPTTMSAPDFNPMLGALDPVDKPVYLSLAYEGTTFGDGSGVTLQVLGKDAAGKVVTAFEALVDVTANKILPVHLAALPANCDDDDDGFLDCSVSGCCASDSVFGDCAPTASAANPWGTEDDCTDDDELDNDCQGGDVVPANSDSDSVADCVEEDACGVAALNDATVFPGAPEQCDAKDNDCDDQTDEGITWTNPAGAQVALGEPCGFGACAGGAVECAPNGAAQCSNMPTDDVEGCDGDDDDVDDNCNGQTDEGCEATDVDGDGVSPPDDCNDFDAGIYPGNPVGEPCCDPAGQSNSAIRAACDLNCDGDVTYCEATDLDHDGYTVAEDDCDDDASDDAGGFPAHLVHPGAAEKCGDGIDQDCIGGDLACAGLTDGDGDGWAAADDCDDGDDAIRPDAAETCNGKDDDCNSLVDDGNPGGGADCGSDVGECARGVEVCSKAGGTAAVVCPNDVESTTELCNGLDDDCDGDTDEDFDYSGIAIGDACDGVGACGTGIVECAQGRTDLATCSTNPNGSDSEDVTEVCDAVDNDCDGTVNEDLTDVDDSDCDRDGVCGDNLQLVVASCTVQGTWTCDYSGVPGYQANAETLCDNLDNDCDDATDEDITFVDALGTTRHVNDGCDGSDADSCSNGLGRCAPGDTSRAICDETNAQNQPEICDGADNDCDGKTDEDYKPGADQVPAKALSGATFAGDNGKYLGASCGTGTCGAGTVQCNANNPERLVCVTPVQPTTDTCDNADNDCNGTTDDRYGPTGDVKFDGGPFAGDAGKYRGQPCGTGACTGGEVVCKDAFSLTCDSLPVGAVNDTCDDVDNDCNGTTDDRFLAGFTGAGKVTLTGALFAADNGKSKLQACGTGTCSGGAVICNVAQSGLVCDSNATARTEQCEGADDSCNGTTDEGFENLDGDPLADCVDPDMDGDGIKDDQNIPNEDPYCAGGDVTDCNDNCPFVQNATQLDHEGDSIGDACDSDDDNDGRLDAVDQCPRGSTGWTSNVASDYDSDGCEDAEAEDNDDDNDGVVDATDRCAKGNLGWTSGAGTDYDLDGCQDLTGTDEDTDDDNDGVLDGPDACERGVKGWTASGANDYDSDGCQDANAEDGDDDNDGKLDAADACAKGNLGWTSTTGVGGETDHDSDGCRDAGEDTDDDGDSKPDGQDGCPLGEVGWTLNATTDHDNDGCKDTDGPDANTDDEDKNDDNDSKLDTADNCPVGTVGWVSSLTTDYDDDGCKDELVGDEDGDDDGDGRSDVNDACPKGEKAWTSSSTTDFDNDGCKDTDGADADSDDEDDDDDNDTLGDAADQCDRSPLSFDSTPATDFDGDGCGDSVTGSVDPNEPDNDDDSDGVVDATDQCDRSPLAFQSDATSDFDGDGCGDSVVGSTDPNEPDADDDDDGVLDGPDQCDRSPLAFQSSSATDFDGDGCGDSVTGSTDPNEPDNDDDSDGVVDATDQCDRSPLAFQSDATSDFDGDGCGDNVVGSTDPNEPDNDDDSDGVVDATDLCDRSPLAFQSDSTSDYDGDGCGDSVAGSTDPNEPDADDDNDTKPDGQDSCPKGAIGWVPSGLTDRDNDGCRDQIGADEDPNDDNDPYLDAADPVCPRGEIGWTASDANDHDQDGCLDIDGSDADALAEDNDDDNDLRPDASDACPRGEVTWDSTSTAEDNDADGCKDADGSDVNSDDEDDNDDNDSKNDGADQCPRGTVGWVSSGTTDYDNDGCKDELAGDEDTDDDNDGVADGPDGCEKGELGWLRDLTTDHDSDGCRDASEDLDDDNDTYPDADDLCPVGATNWIPDETLDYNGNGCKDSGPDEEDDEDDDTVLDAPDLCDHSPPGFISGPGNDADGDGCEDATEDFDADNDGVPEVTAGPVCNDAPTPTCDDNCPAIANPTQLDTDNDGLGDACDPDDDGDGDLDGVDNCPLVSNENQANADGDVPGDACDTCTDADADGWGRAGLNDSTCSKGTADDCNDTAGNVADVDLDNICEPGDTCVDLDGDGWGRSGGNSGCVGAKANVLDCNDAAANTDDTDLDNVCNTGASFCTTGQISGCKDNCAVVPNPDQSDIDRDTKGDACDAACMYGKAPFEVCGDCIDNDCDGATDEPECATRRVITIRTWDEGLAAGHSVALDFNHKQMVDGALSSVTGEDVRIYYRSPTAACSDTDAAVCNTEIDRVVEPSAGFGFNTTTTRLWFATQAAIPTLNADNFDYDIYTGVGTPTTKTLESGVFHFADFFNRGDNGTPGNSWVVDESGGNDIDIDENTLFFNTTGDDNNRPHARRTFTAINGTGTTKAWDVRIAADWVTDGDDNGYRLIMQLANSATMTAPDTGATTIPTTGVGPSVLWGVGSTNPSLPNTESVYTNVGGTATRVGAASINAATEYDLHIDWSGTPNFDIVAGELSANDRAFASGGLTSLDTVRFIAHNITTNDFSRRNFDYVIVRRATVDPGDEPLVYLGAKEPLGSTANCQLDELNMLGLYYLDDATVSVPQPTIVADEAPGATLDLTRTVDSTFGPDFVSVARQLGLGFYAPNANGKLAAPFDGSKYVTGSGKLDAANAATVEVVFENFNTVNDNSYFVDFGASHQFAARMNGSTNTLELVVGNVVAGSWVLPLPQAQRAVFHFVMDSTAAASQPTLTDDRARLYYNGVLMTPTSQGLTANVTIPLGTTGVLNVGNDNSGGDTLQGFLYYVAIYSRALDKVSGVYNDATVKRHALILTKDDDNR